MSYIEVINESKFYGKGAATVKANDKINFSIKEREFTVIVGPSGAGKSTLLHILGGMDSPNEGEVIIDGTDIARLDEKELTVYRREDIGFIFQNYNLIPNLTALENVEMAAELTDNPLNPEEVIKSVGLSHRANNFPAQLSGGEQQRVAIARALVKKPKLLLCDEPTGALDYETGKQVLTLLRESKDLYGATVLVITHNQAITPMADRVIEIGDAQVKSNKVNERPVPVTEIEW
ncbi:MAG TPA: ABC transporter ATP-binding protein [Atopostipes sp.]|nr:ABC transporter ATP-binding protein [Atopostipes sp.]